MTHLVVNIFAVDLGLDDVHQGIHQSHALPQLPPGLAALRAHIPFGETKEFQAHNCTFLFSPPLRAAIPRVYLRQPAVLVKAVSHSKWRDLPLSSAPLLPLSQPERGTITSSTSACKAWSTISIFTESWDERFHSVPATERREEALTLGRGFAQTLRLVT